MLSSNRYGRIIHRMQTNPRVNEIEVAKRILSLMICSVRPLKWREIQAVLSIDFEAEKVDASRRTATHIKDVCGSLVDVLPGDRMEFVHSTAFL